MTTLDIAVICVGGAAGLILLTDFLAERYRWLGEAIETVLEAVGGVLEAIFGGGD